MFISETKNHSEILEKNDLSNDQSQDQRYFPRWELKERVLYRKDEDKDYRETTAKDISLTGASINSQEDLATGQKLDLRFYLPDSKNPIVAQGRVMWSAAGNQDKFIGIEFQWITSEAKDLIFDYIFTYKREELYRRWFKGC